MPITLDQEQERMVQAQLASGRFGSVKEVLDQAFSALPEVEEASIQKPRAKNLVDLFAPLRGLDLDFSRNPSTGRSVDL